MCVCECLCVWAIVCDCESVCVRSGREQGNSTPLQTALKHSARDTLSAPVSFTCVDVCVCVCGGELCKFLQDPQQ